MSMAIISIKFHVILATQGAGSVFSVRPGEPFYKFIFGKTQFSMKGWLAWILVTRTKIFYKHFKQKKLRDESEPLPLPPPLKYCWKQHFLGKNCTLIFLSTYVSCKTRKWNDRLYIKSTKMDLCKWILKMNALNKVFQLRMRKKNIHNKIKQLNKLLLKKELPPIIWPKR